MTIYDAKEAASYFKASLNGCKAVVMDLDQSLIHGTLTGDIGFKFLELEKNKGHDDHYKLGMENVVKILEITLNEGVAEGLRYFFDVIGKTGCALYTTFFDLAKDAIKEAELPGAEAFVKYIKEKELKPFISSMGCDIGVKAAVEYFGCKDGIGNPVIYCPEKSIIQYCKIEMRNGEEKLEKTREMLKRHGLDISEALVLGNDELDYPMMKAARLSVASPLADEEAKQIANIWIANFRAFNLALEALN